MGVYIAEFYWWFQYNICDIARSCFSIGLVFDMYEMSIMLNVDNPISRSPFQVPLARLLVFEIYTISYLEGWFVSCHCLLSSLNLFSSNDFFVIAKAILCVSRFSIPDSGSPRKCCISSCSWCKGRLGSLLYTKKNGVSTVARFGVIL